MFIKLHPTVTAIVSFVVVCLPVGLVALNPAKSNSGTQQPSEIRQSNSVRASTGAGDAASQKHKAEELTRKARTLAQTQSSKNFATAVVMFRESARLFEQTGAHQEAADAYLEAGQ